MDLCVGGGLSEFSVSYRVQCQIILPTGSLSGVLD